MDVVAADVVAAATCAAIVVARDDASVRAAATALPYDIAVFVRATSLPPP